MAVAVDDHILVVMLAATLRDPGEFRVDDVGREDLLFRLAARGRARHGGAPVAAAQDDL